MSKPAINAFLKAIDDGDVAGVEAGLAEGIKINEIYDFNLTERAPPLVRAVARGTTEIVDLLLNNGANVDSRSDKNNTTPLMCAASHNRPDCAKLLLDKGANPNLQDNRGNTALWYAVFSSGTKIVEMLILHNANPNLAGPSNNTALIFAVLTKNIEVAKILIENGADLNAQTTPDKVTPLMNAIMNEDKNMISLLIRKGAKLDMEDTYGKTAFGYALNPQIREFLEAEDAYIKSIPAGGGGGPPSTSASSSSSSSSSSSASSTAGKISYKELFDSSRAKGEAPAGAGSYGSVRRIVIDGELCALKRVEFYATGLNKNMKQSNRNAFYNEVSILQNLKHNDYAVQYINSEEHSNEGFICTEFFENGEELKKAIESGKITESNLEPIVRELLDALTSIHKLNILHNDIKPDNIWLKEGNKIKIFDFGFACFTLNGRDCKESGGSKTFRKYVKVGESLRNKTSDFHALAVTIAKMGHSMGLIIPIDYKNLYTESNSFTVEVTAAKKPLFLWLERVINRLGELDWESDATEAFPTASSASSASSSSSSSSAASKKERTRRHERRALRKSRRRRSTRRH